MNQHYVGLINDISFLNDVDDKKKVHMKIKLTSNGMI